MMWATATMAASRASGPTSAAGPKHGHLATAWACASSFEERADTPKAWRADNTPTSAAGRGAATPSATPRASASARVVRVERSIPQSSTATTHGSCSSTRARNSCAMTTSLPSRLPRPASISPHATTSSDGPSVTNAQPTRRVAGSTPMTRLVVDDASLTTTAYYPQ